MKSCLNSPFRFLPLAGALVVFPFGPLAAAQNRAGWNTRTGCDSSLLAEAKAEFKDLEALRRRNPAAVRDAEFRSASRQYVHLAEACYQARYGSIPKDRRFDDGGLWADTPGLHGQGYRGASADPGTGDPRQHNLFGTKWGADSPYFIPVGDHADATGPRSPGGIVTYSFMANGVNLAAEGSGSNVAIGSLTTFDPCFYQEITDALAAWSAVADIQFIPVTDSGLALDYPGAYGDIRIGAHAIDGVDGVVAHAYYPPPNGYSVGGDLHFDSAEAWACDPSQITGWEIDIGLVALHELGHSLGLAHEFTDPAIMEPAYNAAYNFGPVADDIIGITEIYGGSPLGTTLFGGDVGIGTDHPSASLHVKRTDGTARLLVEESSPVTAARDLLEISNHGNVSYTLRSTAPGALAYRFTSNSSGNLVVSAAGEQKLAVFNSGAVKMGRPPGGSFQFDLNNAGDLTIAGDLTANGIQYASDRNRKRDFREVDVEQILKQVARLPITTWTFQSENTPHMGPMAQDFYALFGLGLDDRHLSPTDTAGVTLAAIQGLYRELQEKDARIATLEGRLLEMETLKAELAEIRTMLADH